MTQNTLKVTLAVLSVLITATFSLTLGSAFSQPGSNNSGTSNQTAGGNTSSQGIGSAQELMESLGNNTELMTNKTAIGSPNASLAEKMSVESNTTENQSMQTGSQQEPNNQTAGNQTAGNQTAGNQTNPITGLIEGIGKMFGNATGN